MVWGVNSEGQTFDGLWSVEVTILTVIYFDGNRRGCPLPDKYNKKTMGPKYKFISKLYLNTLDFSI
jgi:hypothetical protein